MYYFGVYTTICGMNLAEQSIALDIDTDHVNIKHLLFAA